MRGFQYAVALVLPLAVPPAAAMIIDFSGQGFVQQVEATSAQKSGLDWPSIQRLYAHFNGRFIWHNGASLNPLGRQLLAWLEASSAEGLNPADYHVNRLRQLQNHSLPDHRLLRELLLTDGYLRLALDLRLGSRGTREFDPFARWTAEPFDPVATLIEALARHNLSEMLAGLGPTNREYSLLRQALARYREIEAAGGWPGLASEHSLRPGQRAPLIPRLRERLALEGERRVARVDDPALFDEDLRTALGRFQLRHGLKADGVAGPATLQALNVPVEIRIAQLRANLERWRWLPHELAAEHLLVNTAGFHIDYRSHDRVLFSGRTVNGSQQRETPSLIGRITHLVANPQWTVPRRIAVEEMLPRQQADAGYLSGLKIRAFRRKGSEWEEADPSAIDWSPYHRDNFPFILRQEAGAGNSLGRVKFHMPNPHEVFLHDTPAVGLFRRGDRALSAGCVRVEGARRLARLLIHRAGPWEARQFIRALGTGKTLTTQLREPLTVYLTYFTSWVDRAGEVHFRSDIYGRDADLISTMGVEKPPVTAQRSGHAYPASL